MAHLGPHLYSESDPDSILEAATEIFEIDDFTSPSDWEKFVAQVEHLIREWGLATGRDGSGSSRPSPEEVSNRPWRRQSATLVFYDFEFLVTWHFRQNPNDPTGPSRSESSNDVPSESGVANEKRTRGSTPDPIHDMMQTGQEFPTRSHPIHYFFGLNEFVTFSPNAPKEKEDIDNETRAKMALSTLTVAVHNTQCQIPFFVQVMDRTKNMFAGVFAGGGIRTDYQMIVLSRKPPQCGHLSGLLSMFKGKISSGSPQLDIPSVRVTARTTYHLNEMTSHSWSQPPPDLDMFTLFGGKMGFVNDLKQLPFGAMSDPVKRLVLLATWTDLQEEIITDNEIHSDLDPLEAPAWSVGVQFEDRPQCLMKDYLHEFNILCDRHDSLRQVLGELSDPRTDQDENLEKIPNVFDRLTGGNTNYSLPEILQSSGNNRKRSHILFDGPIKSEYLSKILEYLFPDSSSSGDYPYPAEFERAASLDGSCGISTIGIKSAPVDGLVWRLTVVLAHCLHVLGGIKPFAHLLHEFMLEVRFRWENGVPLPGLPNGSPDHAYCLFHQKLQMINCCIEKKRLREGLSTKTTSNVDKNVIAENIEKDEDGASSKSETEEEEFFDCDDDEDNEMEVDDNDEDDEKEKQEVPHWSKEAFGRVQRLNLRLLEYDDWIYVPQCQDPTPMTEDMLAEQAEVMLQLGMDAEGAELRAKMQSASLLSDMESFKAANPGAILADFVRWHSPRDWEESADGKSKGKLSARMQSGGNVWLETWENAKPVPARRQKRLFDDTREAEKVIQYLAQLKPGDAAQMLTPNLIHAAVHRIQQEGVHIESIPHAIDLLKEAVQKLCRLSRYSCVAEVSHYKSSVTDEDVMNEHLRRSALVREVMRILQILEHKVSVSFSLHAKFLKNLVSVESSVREDDKSAVHQQLKDLVANLHSMTEVPVLGGSRGPAGQLICRMFYDAQKASHYFIENEEEESDENILSGKTSKMIFPAPESKEFILKTFANRPFNYSAPCPQRMYAKVGENTFRVAAAFSVDKQFL